MKRKSTLAGTPAAYRRRRVHPGNPLPLPVERGVPMGDLTSMGIGGPAEYLVRPRSWEEVARLLEAVQREGLALRVLGRGTNLIVDDGGVGGVVMVLGPGTLGEVKVEGTRLRAGAGAALAAVVRTSVDRGLAGLEPLVGIPGSVGGAVRMNAGTRAGDVSAAIEEVTVMEPSTGRIHRLGPNRLHFGYRRSGLEGMVVLEALFRLESADVEELRARARALLEERRRTQPLDRRSAGCIFRNPPGTAAGYLIEQVGLKGFRIGGLAVSEKHANFFVNLGGATFEDARRLIDLVRDRVLKAFGVELGLEVEIWQGGGCRPEPFN